MTEPSRMEGKAAAYATEIQEVMSGGYNEMGTPWRLATERKSVGIGESLQDIAGLYLHIMLLSQYRRTISTHHAPVTPLLDLIQLRRTLPPATCVLASG